METVSFFLFSIYNGRLPLVNRTENALRAYIYIPINFFRDFNNLNGKEVRLYLAIKMLEHIEEQTTQETLSKLLGISDRALRQSLQRLNNRGHCFNKKGNSRQRIPSTYHSSHLISSQDGYMMFSYNDLSVYINELCEQKERTRANSELVLYLFFCYKFYSGEINMSQAKIGKEISLTQPAISQIINRLQKKHFIKVNITDSGTYEYILLR